MSTENLWIRPGLEIPLAELHFRFSRSSGPGGQHVNRSETQVELLFDVAHSPSLSESQRARLLETLTSRLDKEGVLRLTSSGSRSQHQNRAEAITRFVRLLQAGLRRQRPRISTKPPAQSRERRLEYKRQRSTIKRGRGKKDWDKE